MLASIAFSALWAHNDYGRTRDWDTKEHTGLIG
jgi:hypothetical protein